MTHKYALGTRLCWWNPTMTALHFGTVEEHNQFGATANPLYWMRVDGSRPNFYPCAIPCTEKELMPITIAVMVPEGDRLVPRTINVADILHKYAKPAPEFKYEPITRIVPPLHPEFAKHFKS